MQARISFLYQRTGFSVPIITFPSGDHDLLPNTVLLLYFSPFRPSPIEYVLLTPIHNVPNTVTSTNSERTKTRICGCNANALRVSCPSPAYSTPSLHTPLAKTLLFTSWFHQSPFPSTPHFIIHPTPQSDTVSRYMPCVLDMSTTSESEKSQSARYCCSVFSFTPTPLLY